MLILTKLGLEGMNYVKGSSIPVCTALRIVGEAELTDRPARCSSNLVTLVAEDGTAGLIAESCT